MTESVRKATARDLGQLAPLFDAYRQFYGQPSDLLLANEFLGERLSRGESLVLLAEGPDGNAVGFVQLYPTFTSVRTARVYILNDLFVSESARNRGVATLLLKAAADVSRAAGAVELRLSTAVTNVSAQRLYEAMGWRREDEFHEYVLALPCRNKNVREENSE
jgi:ribosomal protein S18 acetylase RimI-like enzyme